MPGRVTLASAGTPKRLLIVANFNGFLEKEKKRKEAQPQIEELFRHASGDNSVAIWIEPDMNRATADGGLFSWLRSLLKGPLRLFAKENHDEDDLAPKPIYTSSAQFRLPLNPSETARVRLAVMSFNLVRSK